MGVLPDLRYRPTLLDLLLGTSILSKCTLQATRPEHAGCLPDNGREVVDIGMQERGADGVERGVCEGRRDSVAPDELDRFPQALASNAELVVREI
jgi:hypothetical protein